MRTLRLGPPGRVSGFGDGLRNAEKTALQAIIADTGARTLTYLYDFAHGGQHTIRVERVFEAASDTACPVLIEARGACPPEDAGGPPGGAEDLEAMSGPAHERHDGLLQWCGPDFNPDDPQSARITLRLSPSPSAGTASRQPEREG